MVQFSRPISDDAAVNWAGGTPRFSLLNEVTPDDGDFTDSNNLNLSGESATFTVNMGTVTDPLVGTGHIIRVRARKNISGGDQIDMIVRVQNLATIRSTDNQIDISNTFTTYSFALSTAEANAISSYSNLRVFVEGSNANDVGGTRRIEVSFIEFQVPDAATVLLADDLATPAPTLSSPAIGETHALLADNLTTQAPTLGTPAIGQAHVFTGTDLTTPAPLLSSPSLDSKNLLADNLATGAPIVGQTFFVTISDSRLLLLPAERRISILPVEQRIIKP